MPALLIRTSIAIPHDSTSSPAWRACFSDDRSTISVLVSTSGASSAIACCVWRILQFQALVRCKGILGRRVVDELFRRAPSKDEELWLLQSHGSGSLGAESIWRNTSDQDRLALDLWRIVLGDLVRGRVESKFGRNGHVGEEFRFQALSTSNQPSNGVERGYFREKREQKL